MNIDLSFKSHYGLEVIDWLENEKRYYYPSGSTMGGKDGLILKVSPVGGESWVGVFAFGEISLKGISGIYTTPDPEKFCVISRGAGYIVSATNPTNWEKVKSIPITGIFPIKSKHIIIFADYTELVAYDETGIKWRTKRLAYDSFKIVEVTESLIKGEFWNIQNEASEVFKVDLATGNTDGGITDM